MRKFGIKRYDETNSSVKILPYEKEWKNIILTLVVINLSIMPTVGCFPSIVTYLVPLKNIYHGWCQLLKITQFQYLWNNTDFIQDEIKLMHFDVRQETKKNIKIDTEI